MNKAGKKFIPSNGTEGECFQARMCYLCLHGRDWRVNKENPCEILNKSLSLWPKDGPDEWIYDENGISICTAFEPDTDEIEPEPDPNQLELAI